MVRRGVAVLCGGMVLVGSASTTAGAHNRAHLDLPNGSCVVVGSGKPVVLPDGTHLDLIPSTPTSPFDEVGTSYAMWQGSSPLVPGSC